MAFEQKILKNLGFENIRTPYIGEDLIDSYNGEFYYKDSANTSAKVRLYQDQLDELDSLKEKRSTAFDAILAKSDTIYS